MTGFMRIAIGCLTALALLGACGEDEPQIGSADSAESEDSEGTDAPEGTTSTDDGAEEGTVLTAELTGAAEKPDPGDEDGSGKATITVKTTTNENCFELSVADIGEASAAHIHRGGADVAGPIVVELLAPMSGSAEGCSSAQAELANELVESPEAFYVNVHNAEFPNGAVRGQLAAA